MPVDREQVTALLRECSIGNKEAVNALVPLVYDQLHRLAMSYMRGERKDHTLAATALVHEAYLRMVDSDIAWESRAHFYRVAARVLQHILVDHARARARQKRGAGAEKISLEDVVVVGPEVPAEIIELDAALKRLGEKDPRKAEVVQLTFFAGLTCEETAQVLNVSVITVHRDLRLAKAFLHSQLAAAQ